MQPTKWISKPKGKKMGIVFSVSVQESKPSLGHEEQAECISEHSFACSSQLVEILIIQTDQVENIDEAFSVQTGRSFELDLGLGAPCDAQASCVEH